LSNALNLMPKSMMSKGMNWRRTAMPVYLYRQLGAFHGTNPDLGSARFGDRARPSH
jgi:hypothetical protein